MPVASARPVAVPLPGSDTLTQQGGAVAKWVRVLALNGDRTFPAGFDSHCGRLWVRNFGNSVNPSLPVSFGWDTKSCWSLLSGVYARGSKRFHLKSQVVLLQTGMTKRQTTTNYRKSPQTTKPPEKNPKPPHITANHHKSPPEFGNRQWNQRRCRQTTTNHHQNLGWWLFVCW